ncbi:MAG TPA: single-stranded-DNA-specific exonuclease RecJ [Candidatus Marinimicrobia bacterium]|nr:single-stranded-DNA-specific exonuclease RecJ [Candidatus Neomarinimicrobiota bacterium]
MLIFEWDKKEINAQKVKDLAAELQIPLPIATVLYNRGFTDSANIQHFFNPSFQDLYDPFLMLDMEKAVDRLQKALLNRETVLIYGDYDVDGTTATSLLYLFLHEIGLSTCYYIPDREKEGYGLSKAGIDEAIQKKASLIISCDCGINAFDEIDYAGANGIDLIVTDHHEPAEKLPAALAILDPKRESDPYPFKELCGAGVAFKMLQAFSLKNNIPQEKLYRHLDLVAIGTAADIVPILDENRVLVSKGLEYLNRTNKVGVNALLKVSGFTNKILNVVNIVFGLAPRINAAGRLGEATRAVKLLTSFDRGESRALSSLLEQENKQRQNIEKDTIDQAILQLNATHDIYKDKLFVLSGENWHQGVIGIVASKIKEIYNRPVVMISTQNGIGKGSARSIADFDLYNAFTRCADLLENYGGHKMAAGLTIKKEMIPRFQQRIQRIANQQITEEMLNPRLTIDCEIDFAEINQDLLLHLKKMAPFGPGNMRPVFMSRNLTVAGLPRIVGENHLKFKASKNKKIISAIGWKLGTLYEMLVSNRPLDMAFVIEENEWNGIKEIQLNIKDIRYADE